MYYFIEQRSVETDKWVVYPVQKLISGQPICTGNDELWFMFDTQKEAEEKKRNLEIELAFYGNLDADEDTIKWIFETNQTYVNYLKSR